MLRFLWKCVLEVLPPTCATVVAGILLSAYHEHALPLQNVIDPRGSFDRVPAPEGDKQQQAVIAPRVQSERATEPAGIDSRGPTPGSDANSPAPPAEGIAADAKTQGVPDTKPREAATTDAQSAQLNAVLMASSPMSQPPAEIKAAPSPEAKAPDSVAADGPPAPGGPAEAVPATEVSAAEDKPAGAPSPGDQAIASGERPRFSRHVPKPAHKVPSFKAKAERLPSPLVAMVPLPPPAAPATDSLEAAPTIPPGRSVLRSRPHAGPARPQVVGSTTPQANASPPLAISSQAIGPTPPQGIGPTPPAVVPNVGVVGAAGPTSAQSLPAAPQGGSGQEDATKTSEPKRVFGVPIPSTIVAVGGALDPRPVLSAGQKAFDKIVMTAKSVVPDFGRSQ
jgi:hypothetical protein